MVKRKKSKEAEERENTIKKFLDRIAGGEKFIPLPDYTSISFAEMDYVKRMMSIRPLVVQLYAIQDQRIRLGNLIVATIYNKLGFNPGQRISKRGFVKEVFPEMLSVEPYEDESPEETEQRVESSLKAFAVIEEVKSEYKRVTDGLIAMKERIEGLKVRDSKIITDSVELVLVEHFLDLEKSEKDAEYVLKLKLANFGEIADWLLKVPGVGTRFAGYLLAYFNPYRARHASSYVAYAGLSVEPDGKATSKQHMVIREYIDKNQKVAYKDSIKYSDHIKSKVLTCVKLGFLRKNNPYRKFYDLSVRKYIARGMNPIEDKNWIHKRSLRLPAKQFLIDFWLKHRLTEGLEISVPWEVAHLGMFDHRAALDI